jgi:hypothetical protein
MTFADLKGMMMGQEIAVLSLHGYGWSLEFFQHQM